MRLWLTKHRRRYPRTNVGGSLPKGLGCPLLQFNTGQPPQRAPLASAEFYPGRCMVAGVFQSAHLAVDAGSDQSPFQGLAQQ